MTNKITFKNYRIFKENQDLELKPITIIFGKNNTGKSAILKLPQLVESSLKTSSKEVFELYNQDFTLASEMRDIIYGKASRAMEFSLENTLGPNPYKLIIRFFVDTTSKDQQSKIEYWHFKNNEYSIEINLENEQYVEKENQISNISFSGCKLRADNLPNIITDEINALSFNIDYISSIRENPARDIRIAPTASNSGHKGGNTYQKLISSFLTLEKSLFNSVSNWYSSNFDGWSINIDKTRDPIYHIEIEHNDIKTNILDAGVGIVQLLPIVIRAMEKCEKETLIIIEEPETHLHPAAHANIGQLLFDSTQSDPLKKYIVETHSLNLIMRLRRLVAEDKLSINDISLYYVEFNKEETASSLKKITINADGSVDNWPGKVFNETLDEAIAIRNQQIKK